MDLDQFRDHCLSKKGTSEGTPFGDDVLVYKVMNKIFAITSFVIPLRVNLKCNPERVIELREEFEEVLPGYHMDKKHWNTVVSKGKMSDKMLKELTDHSYELIVGGLKKAEKEKLLKL
jgi:predicted DNA-binding protein (MmcQ/YjbR family)